MANYVVNQLKIISTKKVFKDILKNVVNENGDVDFNLIDPMPEELLITPATSEYIIYGCIKAYIESLDDSKAESLLSENERKKLAYYSKKDHISFGLEELDPIMGEKYYNNIIRYGYNNWYEWALAHWGTKWNSHNDISNVNTDLMIIEFQTANSMPGNWLESLSKKYPDVTFRLTWADEDIGYNLGTATLVNGECTKLYQPKFGTDKAIDFACNAWGYDRKEYEENFK